MTDRELLEFAARAAGIEYQRTDDGDVIEYFGGGLQLAFDGGKWNPLTDDGDALRLAVKLQIDIKQYGDHVVAWFDGGYIGTGRIPYEGNPYAATRRAITKAAAAIGKDMP